MGRKEIERKERKSGWGEGGRLYRVNRPLIKKRHYPLSLYVMSRIFYCHKWQWRLRYFLFLPARIEKQTSRSCHNVTIWCFLQHALQPSRLPCSCSGRSSPCARLLPACCTPPSRLRTLASALPMIQPAGRASSKIAATQCSTIVHCVCVCVFVCLFSSQE